MMDKIIRFTGYLTILMAFKLLIYVSVLLFYPPVIVEINETTPVNPIVKAGDIFFYEIDYCRYLSGSGVVSRTWHRTDESHTYPTPKITPVTVKGCAKTKLPVVTYKTMVKGEYYLLVEATIKPNAIRTDHLILKIEGITIE